MILLGLTVLNKHTNYQSFQDDLYVQSMHRIIQLDSNSTKPNTAKSRNHSLPATKIHKY